MVINTLYGSARRSSRLAYSVVLCKLDADGYAFGEEELLGKFVGQGDAAAFAIHRARLPFKNATFRVYRGSKCVYSTGL